MHKTSSLLLATCKASHLNNNQQSVLAAIPWKCGQVCQFLFNCSALGLHAASILGKMQNKKKTKTKKNAKQEEKRKKKLLQTDK